MALLRRSLRGGGTTEVATIRVYMRSDPEAISDRPDRELFPYIEERRTLIEAELRERVTDRLGPEFAAYLRIESGSVTLTATIVVLGKMAVGYGSLRAALEYLQKDLKLIATRLAGRHGFEVQSAAYTEVSVWASANHELQRGVRSGSATSIESLFVLNGLAISGLLSALLALVFWRIF